METSVTQSTKRPSLTEDNDELARDYDRVSVDRQLQSGKMLVRDLAPRAGERVLDVGCGTGLLAQHIADLVGPTGHVLGVDPLPLRIELAQARPLSRTKSLRQFSCPPADRVPSLRPRGHRPRACRTRGAGRHHFPID